jgi:acyl transferase domain-containing protein
LSGIFTSNTFASGQGAQWQGMGQQLMSYAVFAKSIRHQDHVLQSLTNIPDWTLESIINGTSTASIQSPNISQLVCTGLQIALVDLLRSWSIVPQASVGHSSGEMAAAYASGFISAAEAIVVAYCRGCAVSQMSNPREGSMLAVGLPSDLVRPYLSDLESKVQIAAVNSPSSVTLSGDVIEMNQLQNTFKAEGVFVRKLETGGMAYHSHHMTAPGVVYEEMLDVALEDIRKIGHGILSDDGTRTTWISSVRPDKSMATSIITSAYWRRNLTSPVQFSKAIEILFSERNGPPDVLVEIGPHSVLRSPLKQICSQLADAGIKTPVYVSTIKRHDDGMRNVLDLCGNL